MKPLHEYCTKYCKDYPCTRKLCNKGMIFRNDKIEMVDRSVYDKIRKPERTRAYRESRVTQVNF